MIDPYVLLAPVLLLLVVALLQSVGCSYHGPTPSAPGDVIFTPPPDKLGGPTSVTVGSVGATTYYYTTDGTLPTTNPPSPSTQVVSGLSVSITISTSPTTINAIATNSGGSSEGSAMYTLVPIAEVPERRAKGQVDDDVTATAIFPNPVTVGNLLVVAGAEWRDAGGTTITAIQDTLNTPYTSLEFVSTSDPNYRLFIAYGRAPASGANSVTVTTAAAAYTSFGIDEFSGIQDATPLETVGGGVSGGPNTTPSAPITTGPNALILGTMTFHVLAIVQVDPGMGYTQIAEEENNSATNGHTSFNAEFKVVTTTATAQTHPVSWTLGTSSEWDIYRVSFRGWPI